MQGADNSAGVARTRILGGLTALIAALLVATGAPPARADSTLFPLAKAVHAGSVAFGPDGNLWFTAVNASEDKGVVGRLAPNGQVTEFQVPGQGYPRYGVNSIVSGPDGNLWFVEPHPDRVSRVTTAGEITQFQLPADSEPRSIVAGPDGNLWFTERGANAVGRITPGGDVSQFPLPPGSTPTGIAAGPDGALWFAETLADRIGRISTDGQIAQFRLRRTTRPHAICSLPRAPRGDGNRKISPRTTTGLSPAPGLPSARE